jgi:drug/metabolite transporter (DMT)-like permease
MQPKSWQVGIVLSIGVLAVSTAAIFIRLTMAAAEINSVGFSLFIAASRLIISAIILIPTWQGFKKDRVSTKALIYAIAAGVCLALHFATWITSLAFTSIAASTALVTTNPIWVAILSQVWLKERLKNSIFVAIVIAVAGSIIIALGDYDSNSIGTNSILGDILALIGAWMASLYLLFGSQAQRQQLSTSSYIAIAYSTAALILSPLPLLFGVGYVGYPSQVYLYILLMAIISQIIGHTSFNWALRWLSPTLVTLTILFEPIGSSVLGYLVFAEIPSPLVILGGLVVLISVAIAVITK